MRGGGRLSRSTTLERQWSNHLARVLRERTTILESFTIKDAFWGLGKIGRRWFSRLTKLNCGITLSNVEQPLSHPELVCLLLLQSRRRCKHNGWFSTGSINVDKKTGIDRFRNKFGMTSNDFPRPLRDTKGTAKRRAACDPVCLVLRVARGRVWGKIGFTLAEVLITLGIIGVVAAMTLPTLVGKYQKQVTVAHLKKFYTTMNQALKRSEVDNGEYKYWQAGSEIGAQAYFEKYWAPYLKGYSICETYSDCYYPSRQPFTYIDGSYSGAVVVMPELRTTIKLSDGTVIVNFVAMGGDEANGIAASASGVMYVDINGGKAPNIFGKDVFLFRRNEKGLISPEGINASVSTVNESCSKTGTGTYCAAKIVKDGWEITDDYPW